MELSCKHVWEYISNYIDGSVDPEVRAQIERHLEHCEICSAILDSTRNILYLTADDRTFALPVGYSARLHARLEKELTALQRPDAGGADLTGRDEG
jgi:anti-sigma factor RsiW